MFTLLQSIMVEIEFNSLFNRFFSCSIYFFVIFNSFVLHDDCFIVHESAIRDADKFPMRYFYTKKHQASNPGRLMFCSIKLFVT